MRNGSVTPEYEGSAKQTQVMLLGGWSAEDVAEMASWLEPWLEPWLRRYSRKKENDGNLPMSFFGPGAEK